MTHGALANMYVTDVWRDVFALVRMAAGWRLRQSPLTSRPSSFFCRLSYGGKVILASEEQARIGRVLSGMIHRRSPRSCRQLLLRGESLSNQAGPALLNSQFFVVEIALTVISPISCSLGPVRRMEHVWAHGDNDLVNSSQAFYGGRSGDAGDAACEHRCLHSRPGRNASACRGDRRDLHRRCRAGSWLCKRDPQLTRRCLLMPPGRVGKCSLVSNRRPWALE